MKKKVTIYDVAEAADVSLATVSRVINGSNVVKPATRERVLETIKRLDFKPNQIARGLATSKTTNYCSCIPTVTIWTCKRYDWWYWRYWTYFRLQYHYVYN